MALLLAFFIDEIEIVGIVADYGNVQKMAVENAHFLITKQRIEISRYSVVQNVPLLVPHLRFTDVHGNRARSNYSKGECD